MTFGIKLNIILEIAILFLITSCQKSANDQRQTSRSIEGTYFLTPSGSIKAGDIQLVTSKDGASYGTIYLAFSSDSLTAPLTLDSISEDSIFTSFWYGQKQLNFRRKPPMDGILNLGDSVLNVTLSKQSESVAADLEASKELVPLPLGIEAATYASHKKDGSFYTISWSKGGIYYITNQNDQWQKQELHYDRNKYKFSSLGLSPDENTLIGHASRVDKDAPDDGGSIYLMHLKDESTIASIEKLPDAINTPSYDNFPDFTPSGDIIYSSWGKPQGLANEGEGDIYLTTVNGQKYQTEVFDANVNTEHADAGPSISQDQNVLLFHRALNRPNSTDKIYASIKKDGKWDSGELLAAPVNIERSYQYAPRLDQQEQYLYFTSHHRGSGALYRVSVDQIKILKQNL